MCVGLSAAPRFFLVRSGPDGFGTVGDLVEQPEDARGFASGA